MKTLYQLFGLHERATKREIQAAYKRLMAVHHPDRGGNVEVAQRINAIAEVLLDPERRARYDARLAEKRTPAPVMVATTSATNSTIRMQAIWNFVVDDD